MCGSSRSLKKGSLVVEPTAVSPFAAGESFYVIVGSSAAALTGLQFVVVVLGAEARSIGPEVSAFGTPTVVHFCAALLISAILSVPWRAVSNAGLALDAVGVAGVAYMAGVVPRGARPARHPPRPGGGRGALPFSPPPSRGPPGGGGGPRRGTPPPPLGPCAGA